MEVMSKNKMLLAMLFHQTHQTTLIFILLLYSKYQRCCMDFKAFNQNVRRLKLFALPLQYPTHFSSIYESRKRQEAVHYIKTETISVFIFHLPFSKALGDKTK